MKKPVLIQLLLLVALSSLSAQKKFWEVAGKLPILEQGVNKSMVLKGFNWVEVQDSFFVTITNFSSNSKNVMLGWIGEHLSRGFYKSINGGKTWEKIVPKIPVLPDQTVLQRLKQSPFAETEVQLYLNGLKQSRDIVNSIFAYGEDFYMVNGGYQNRVLLRSKDQGKTWKEICFLDGPSHIDFKNNKLIKIDNVADINNSTFMGDNSLTFSESQDSGRTWVKKFEGRSNVGFIYSSQSFGVDTKYSSLFYRYKSENVWYIENLFNSRKKETSSDEVYQASIRIIHKAPNGTTLFSLVEPRGWLNSMILDVDGLDLCQSNDGGLTWTVVSRVKIPNGSGGIHFVDCNNVIYVSLDSPVQGFCRSANGGKTWEVLSGLPENPLTGAISISPDGYLQCLHKKLIYKSNEKICINSISAEPKDNYEIVFYAYGPTTLRPKSNLERTLETSPTGHIYVGFVKNNKIEKVKGLSPKDGVFNMGKVDETTDESYLLGYHTHCFAVKATEKQYIDALKIAKSYYFSPISDCVSYAADIANLLGLKTPSITDAVLLPTTYIGFLKDNNKAVGIESQWCKIKPKP